MKIHILGICGTFMGGLAILAREMGHEVSGTDANVYPPMSDFLRQHGIEIHEGYETAFVNGQYDLIIIGNTLSRGNPAVEYVLNESIPYRSGPQWLAENVLQQRKVIAIAGTHGKTTTTSMAAWVLEQAGLSPGFLIGGIAENFGTTARLGKSEYFVIEADEYDTAFFDKRSKFIHYCPTIQVINNIEYDHADIFGEIEDIFREFRRLVAIIPENGSIIYRGDDPNISSILDAGCWSHTIPFCGVNTTWSYRPTRPDYSEFEILHNNRSAVLSWDLLGEHNASNALAVAVIGDLVGIDINDVVQSLKSFKSVKRRLEILGEVSGIRVYDDFAHHPTAITTTLEALRAHVGEQRIIAVFEPRSNTMRLGVHSDTLGQSFCDADLVYAFQPDGLNWDLAETFNQFPGRHEIHTSVTEIVTALQTELCPGDNVVIMSNGGFGGIHQMILDALQNRPA
ncbi:MAG: UDP-N-acetylmuramate:L-alanyl-gamma-D-glutamyl-meso-diaminopimelate ligase [Gammaproteobacteria bacterium]|nr:UDP-N-acetylmuramate:L-alanyl-gamma-D-glutamyl-meso-diaminopimelate ligase [Gammaproteobacteria bacterium]